MDLNCTICTKDRKPVRFTAVMKDGHEPLICQYCKTRAVIGEDKRISIDSEELSYSEKTCLRCSNNFESVNDYRVCDPCKNSDAWKSGQDELSVINLNAEIR